MNLVSPILTYVKLSTAVMSTFLRLEHSKIKHICVPNSLMLRKILFEYFQIVPSKINIITHLYFFY